MPTTIERRARSVSRKRAVPGSTAFAALAGVLVLALSFAPAAGATIVKRARDTFWGGYAGYFQDPDGHLWEVVWNPQLMP